jgi:hypothetical protein
MASDASDGARAELAQVLLSYLSSGQLDARVVLPAIQALLGAPAAMPTRCTLRETLRRQGLIESEPIVQWLSAQDAADALRGHRMRRQGQSLPPDLERELAHLPLAAPLGWARTPDIGPALMAALWLLRDRALRWSKNACASRAGR